ncbi:MAG TPA: hypothetical protein VFG59_10790, partial [Anaeromyxobacter sp.]|nr:hypothetical protein [Anaeromyxobacter sp.]
MRRFARSILLSTPLALLAALHLGCGSSGGSNGSSGTNGKTTLIATNAEPAGTNCASGGQRVDVGIDANDNGTLDAGEVSKTVYLCNGAAGTTPVAFPEQAGTNCAAGGVKLEAGGQTTYVCNGSAGAPGTAGAPGQSVQVGEAGDACPNGGLSFQVGSGQVRYVCNGKNGNDGADGHSVEIGDAGEACQYGGLAFRVGAGSPQYVCNGAPGQDGASATVTPDYGEACENGGAIIQVGNSAPVSVCNGQSVALWDDDEGWCDYGGYLLGVGNQKPVPVCNGAPGEPGADAACAYNHAPSIDWIETPPGPLYPYVGQPLTVHAYDPDVDDDDQTLTYSISGAGALFSGGENGEFEITPAQAGGPFNFSVIVSDGCQLAVGSFTIDSVLPGWTEVGDPPSAPETFSQSIALNGGAPYVSYRSYDDVTRVMHYQSGAWVDTGFSQNDGAGGYFSSLASFQGSLYLATGNGLAFRLQGATWTPIASYAGFGNLGQVKLFSDGNGLYVGYLFQLEGDTFYRVGVESYDPGGDSWSPVGYPAAEEGIPSAQAYQNSPIWIYGNYQVGGFDLFVDDGTPYVLFPAAADQRMTVMADSGSEGWSTSKVPELYVPGPAHLAVAGGVVYAAESRGMLWLSNGEGWSLVGDMALTADPA